MQITGIPQPQLLSWFVDTDIGYCTISVFIDDSAYERYRMASGPGRLPKHPPESPTSTCYTPIIAVMPYDVTHTAECWRIDSPDIPLWLKAFFDANERAADHLMDVYREQAISI